LLTIIFPATVTTLQRAAVTQPKVGDTIVIPGDFESFRKHLAPLGVEEHNITDISNAIKEDTKAQDKPTLGKRVQAWIGKMVVKAASGAWNTSMSVAGTALVDAVTKYFTPLMRVVRSVVPLHA